MMISDEKKRISPGFSVGMLTVVGPSAARKNGYTVWHCRCRCGGEKLLDTRSIQRGTVLDCGCSSKVKPGQKDLTGQRFGRLTCLSPTDERTANGNVIWRCICDCGKECVAASNQLTYGYKKSCGCLGNPALKEYVGKRFGQLTVINYEGKEDGMHRWRCLCDCGKETVVGQTRLQSGKTKSCGCLQASVWAENLKLCDGTSVTVLEAFKDRVRSSNKSGYTGVYPQGKNGKFVAKITFKGKSYYLGLYDTVEEAFKARRRGEEMRDNFLAQYYRERS